MSDSDHPEIAKARRYAADEFEDRPAFYEHFAVTPPATRVDMLQALEKEINESECSLRSRAQLLSLHRRLSDTHSSVSRAKR
jgi:hypothetical protein